MIYLNDVQLYQKFLVNPDTICVAEPTEFYESSVTEVPLKATRLYFVNGNIKYVQEDLTELNYLIKEDLKRKNTMLN